MLQYYTLEEAATILHLPTEQAKKILDERKVRQYRDGRGGMRYVASAVDELARSIGHGSDAELQLGDIPRSKTGHTPPPAAGDEAVGTFDFSLSLEDSDSEDVPIANAPLDKSASSSKKGGPKSPAPKPGSDSDVRLVPDGADLGFEINAESDVNMADDPGPKSAKKLGGGVPVRNPSTPPPRSTASRGDSDVRIVPFEDSEASDVSVVGDAAASGVNLGATPVKKQSDSDIRLEEVGRRASGGKKESHVTEEIDLDAEAQRAEAPAKSKIKGGKVKPGSGPIPLPTESPFELSADDADSGSDPGVRSTDSSGDFELTPAGEESLEVSSSELRSLGAPVDEDVSLGELSDDGANPSGIGLGKPRDSGISLEGSESSSDAFELSLDSEEPQAPIPAAADDSDSSEFELSLDADSSGDQPVAPADASDSSEFELSLDAEGSDEAAAAVQQADSDDSDSEFELTLDDSGGLVAAEQSEVAEEDPDNIFETEFDVPALDAESGSEAVALEDGDTDLESSDFDLALDEADADQEGEESASQVVALEEEDEADEGAKTVARRSAGLDDEDAEAADFGGIDGDESEELVAADEEDEEAAPATTLAGAPAPPTPWGALPAIVMIPCTIVMFLAVLMGLELLHGMWGYQQPRPVGGFLTDSLARQFMGDDALPKE